MEGYISVREIARQLQKSEETIKRWIRAGRFPNAHKDCDKDGWRIPTIDIQLLLNKHQKSTSTNPTTTSTITTSKEVQTATKELVLLAFQAVTMTVPSENIIDNLSKVGIKRTLEILLIMQQSPKKVKNSEGFIRKAIEEGWTTTTLPMKKESNIASMYPNSTKKIEPIPFYNWLEE